MVLVLMAIATAFAASRIRTAVSAIGAFLVQTVQSSVQAFRFRAMGPPSRCAAGMELASTDWTGTEAVCAISVLMALHATRSVQCRKVKSAAGMDTAKQLLDRADVRTSTRCPTSARARFAPKDCMEDCAT